MLNEKYLSSCLLSKMRIVLGDSNYLKTIGENNKLETPSINSSGLKFNIHADLQAGVTYKIWVESDAANSIVHRRNGKYGLKPVIRSFTVSTSGAIKGYVSPSLIKTYVMVISEDDDTFATFNDIMSGYYLIVRSNAGYYNIRFVNDSLIESANMDSVKVFVGETTLVGTVFLN